MQHGGSGLGRSIETIERMPLGHIVRDLERMKERRKAEAEAIKAAYKHR